MQVKSKTSIAIALGKSGKKSKGKTLTASTFKPKSVASAFKKLGTKKDDRRPKAPKKNPFGGKGRFAGGR